MRWSHLVKHGLLGGSLLAAATASANPCDDKADQTVVLTFGVDISPKFALIAGVEGRKCVTDNTELMLRLELGGGSPRVIGGARTRPLEAGDYADQEGENLGVEAGAALSFNGDLGAHLAGSYGAMDGYLAVQALFPLTSLRSRPNVSDAPRISLVAGFAPWLQYENTTVDGRPLTHAGRVVHPAVRARLATPRTAEDRAVRDHFTQSAQAEYSSVWTFLRLAAELVAVGAPERLVAAALDAADDEVRHAEACARAAGGLSLAPLSMLAAQPRFTTRSTAALSVLALEAWCEGCLNEGAAAEQARLAGIESQDATGAMLAAIARDEAGHAALAWAVLHWVHEVAPAVVSAIRSVPAHSLIAMSTRSDAALTRRGVPSTDVTLAARDHAERIARSKLRTLLG